MIDKTDTNEFYGLNGLMKKEFVVKYNADKCDTAYGLRDRSGYPGEAAPSGSPRRGRVGWATGLACAGVKADSPGKC